MKDTGTVSPHGESKSTLMGLLSNREEVSKRTVPHKESKEYLDRAQNIDLLIALARIAEIARPNTSLDLAIAKKIEQTIDKI